MEVRDEKGRYVRKYKDIKGQRFFRLVALEKVAKQGTDKTYWKCKCDCGNEKIVRLDSLLNGHAKSCGCYLKETQKDGHTKTHGESKTRLYKIWLNMKYRCFNKNCLEYHNYGGRGITLCDEWKDFKRFKDWALSSGYNESLEGKYQSIDRIDVNGNYEPSNCRWADYEIQNYNKRCTIRVKIENEELTLIDISRHYNIPLTTLRPRYQKYKKGLITLEDLVMEKR